jgi:glycosyltransferase involved in cell wall biosynthesis
VCLVTFDGEVFLREQLESVLAQLTADDELVLVDNASRDGTRAVVEDLQRRHPGLHTLFLEENVGIVRGFERCVALATGRFVFLCDQDDVWLPGRLERQIGALADADVSVVNAALVDASLRPLHRTTFEIRTPRLGWGNLVRNGFVGCTMAFRSEALDRLLPIPDSAPMHDWYLAQVAHREGLRLHRDPEVLHLYRRHGRAASHTGGRSTRPLLVRLLDRIRLAGWMLRRGPA